MRLVSNALAQNKHRNSNFFFAVIPKFNMIFGIIILKFNMNFGITKKMVIFATKNKT